MDNALWPCSRNGTSNYAHNHHHACFLDQQSGVGSSAGAGVDRYFDLHDSEDGCAVFNYRPFCLWSIFCSELFSAFISIDPIRHHRAEDEDEGLEEGRVVCLDGAASRQRFSVHDFGIHLLQCGEGDVCLLILVLLRGLSPPVLSFVLVSRRAFP